ncbi:MAG: GNAT family protein [Chloroflexota bacterium]
MIDAAAAARVRLRDITMADADLLDAWAGDPAAHGEFNDFGLQRDPVDRAVLAERPLRNERNGQLIVERLEDGRAIGTVGWHLVRYGPNAESDAWNIGIALIPEARGHGFGTQAQHQVALYLFEHTGVNRVEASTDVDNIAEHRSLEKAGFVCEGIARGAQFRAGGYHDLVTYSRVRSDPPG